MININVCDCEVLLYSDGVLVKYHNNTPQTTLRRVIQEFCIVTGQSCNERELKRDIFISSVAVSQSELQKALIEYLVKEHNLTVFKPNYQ